MPPAADRADTPVHELAALLSVQSLDLRAQYEAKLRLLTRIQRDIEMLRVPQATTAQRQRVLDALQRRFDELVAANRDASDALALVRGALVRVQRERRSSRKLS